MADQIFPDCIIVGPNNGNNNGAIALDGNFQNDAQLTIGGFSRDGRIQLRDRNGQNTMFVGTSDDGPVPEVPVLIGGGPRSGRVRLFRGNNNNRFPAIDLSATFGTIVLGAPPDEGNPGVPGALRVRSGAGSQTIILTGNDGNCECVSLTETADLRFKKGIVPLSNALDQILSMRGVSYQWEETGPLERLASEKSQIGFIGQEMEDICPEIVFTNSEGYKSLNYSRLTPILVEAIKEQHQLIKQQASSLGEALEQIAHLETTMKILNA